MTTTQTCPDSEVLEKLDFSPGCGYVTAAGNDCANPAFWAVFLKCNHVTFMCQACVIKARRCALKHKPCGAKWAKFDQGVVRMEPIK